MRPPPFGGTVTGNRWDLAGPAVPGLRVSVVVSHFEQPQELARTLAALGAQTRPPDEVVVTDDGSAVAPTVPDGVRLVRQDDRGFRVAAARNRGVEATTGELLVLLDADTTPEPGCVEALADLPSRLPECLVVGRRRHASYAADGSRTELPEPAWLTEAYAASSELLDADETSHRFVIGAIVGCSRWWWDELGGCDESFTAYGGEDWDLAARSWRHGGLVAHRRDAVAWHDGPDAGARSRSDAALLGETVAIADHVAVPGTGWRGLVRGPADLVVSCAPVMTPTELLVTVDGLWAAVPTARVVLSAEHRALVGDDPRLVPGVPDEARLHLDLRHGALGDWRAAVGSLDGHAHRDLGVGTLTDLRLARRAERWGRLELAPVHPVADEHLTPWAPRHTLEAWLGGWAR
ncbi:glycosyltransferase [Nocardioides rubriscoriae]|uniref:glycosyltransferase n=1 Tax=Nocardioides rubriscoriae TaxID=642762 RepID=UPI00147963FA|nr:glycosyltransferase [Nocardioides rubriscoriae]